MKLFDFQEQAVKKVLQFLRKAIEIKKKFGDADVDPFVVAWSSNSTKYSSLRSPQGQNIPNVCISVPTGGGKTLIGLSCVAQLIEQVYSDTNFCLWLVPNDAIYAQFRSRLEREGYYSDLDALRGRKVVIKTLESNFTIDDRRPDEICVLLLTYQSLIRAEKARRLNIFKPRDDLSFLLELPEFSGSVPSLFEFIKFSRPLVVVDEAHRIYTVLGRSFLSELNPAMILELTATPKAIESSMGLIEPNIIFTATGSDLINNQLIKHPINYVTFKNYSIKELLREVIKQQTYLEQLADDEGISIIPKVLISAQFTDRKFSGVDSSVYAVRKHLVDLGVSADFIKIKSSSNDEIASIPDLDDHSVEVRYLLTKRALMEGWDCKSVYLVVLINQIGADITNIQLVGRGLRQPYQYYFPKQSLNAISVLTNSSKHSQSINKLKSFLEEKGLSDLGISSASASAKAGEKDVVFKLKAGGWNKFIPQIIVKDRKKLLSTLDNESFRHLDGLDCIDRNEGYDSVDDKEVLSSVIDLKTAKSAAWQSQPYILSEKSSYDDLLLWFCEVIHPLFPNAMSAYNFLDRQLKLWMKQGVNTSQICTKKEGIVHLIKAYIEESHRNAITSTYIKCAQKGLLSIELNKKGKLLPKEISYKVSNTEQYEQPFEKNIYGNVPKYIFNGQELEFADLIDSLSISGWVRNDRYNVNICYDSLISKIYPDFIVFDKRSPKITVVIIETKGAHLIDSEDTKRKTSLFNVLNSIAPQNINFIIGTFEYCTGKLKQNFSR